jgi:hypothetical protein
MRAPTIPSLPDQLKPQPSVVWSGDALTVVESADAWRGSEVAIQINDHAKELLVYATQLIEFRRARAAARVAKGQKTDQKTDKGTARSRESQELYSSTGLRERILDLLYRLSQVTAPPTPHLLALITLLDGRASANMYNLFKKPDATWEPTNVKFYTAATFIAQNVPPGTKPQVKELACILNLNPRTIGRWLKDPGFRQRAGLDAVARKRPNTQASLVSFVP